MVAAELCRPTRCLNEVPQYGGIVVRVDRRFVVVVVDDAGVVPDAGQLVPAHASQQLD